MKHLPQSQVPKENVTNFGSQKTTIQWFRKPEESTHFMLRRFEIDPGGHIGTHAHPEEHQIFIVKGPILLIDKENNEIKVQSDEFVYVPSNESHGYRNPNPFPVVFLCGISKISK
jgi:quercetin dioxygenase-like cupin family protein